MSLTKRIFRYVLLGLGGLVALLLVVAVLALTYRGFRQFENSRMLEIKSANGIEEQKFITVNGMQQWTQVRGEDRNNPVILFLHGGPGYSAIPFSYRTMREWEKHFTIFHWDQRGAGKTFVRNSRSHGPNHTIDRMVKDAIQVAEYARRRLGKEKVIVIGHSWGSVLGTELVRRRPDLFYAYVGTGQVVSIDLNEVASYDSLMKRVVAAGDQESVAELKAIGAPPYKSPQQLARQRNVVSRYPAPTERTWDWDENMSLLFAPGYSLREAFYVKNTQDLDGTLFKELFAYDARARGRTFRIPIFLFQGEDDTVTPASLLTDYIGGIDAPAKQLVLFDDGGHNAVNICKEFLRELITRVRPLATNGTPPALAAEIVRVPCTPQRADRG